MWPNSLLKHWPSADTPFNSIKVSHNWESKSIQWMASIKAPFSNTIKKDFKYVRGNNLCSFFVYLRVLQLFHTRHAHISIKSIPPLQPHQCYSHPILQTCGESHHSPWLYSSTKPHTLTHTLDTHTRHLCMQYKYGYIYTISVTKFTNTRKMSH